MADRKYSTGWAVGGWFIPVGNLIIPYNVMKEVWKGSSPAAYNPKNSHAWKKVSDHAPVREWWIVNIVLTAVNMGLFDLNGISPPDSSFGAIYRVMSYMLTAIFAMFAVSLVKGIQSRQSGRLQAIHDAAIIDEIELT